ncbi:MAG: hypothetical protein VB142_00955 [Burkholderia sp.]
MMDTTLASIFASVYDGYAKLLTYLPGNRGKRPKNGGGLRRAAIQPWRGSSVTPPARAPVHQAACSMII